MLESVSPELFWFLLGLGLLLAELVLPGFVIVFFGVGAWVTALGVALGLLPSVNIQLIVFLIASIASLVLFRKHGRALFEGRVSGKPLKDMDDVRGSKVIVTVDIRPNALDGKVEFNGTAWQAQADVPIARGATVEIVERKDLILRVKPIE
jgi:membrane protein implicated in regulation of membrane protease activity